MTTPTPLPPGHRWREYKGVTYRDERYVRNGIAHASAALVIAYNHNKGLNDDDHAALMELKANPTEPIPEKPVVRDAVWGEVRQKLSAVWNTARNGPSALHDHWEGLDTTTDRIVRLLRASSEPVPVMTVEGVLREFFDERNFPVYGTTILDLCARLRAAFPQIDASPLTLDDHVNALVGMGATKGEATQEGSISRSTWFLPGDTVIIVPNNEDDS